MMKKIVLFISLLLPFALQAQKKMGKARVDSLSGALDKASAEDTNKVKILIDLANTLYVIDPDAGVKYASNALTLAKDIDYTMGVARSSMALGLNYDAKSNYPDALAHYLEAQKAYEKISFKRGIALSYWGVANIFNSQKNYDKSLQYGFKALAIFEVLKDKPSMNSMYVNIANNYLFLPKPDADKALEYYQKALPFALEQEDSLAIGVDYLNIGNVYSKKRLYSKSLSYYALSRIYLSKEDMKSSYAHNLANAGECYIKLTNDTNYAIKPDSFIYATKGANLNKAVAFSMEAKELSTAIGDVDGVMQACTNLSLALEYSGDYKGALENHKQAEVLKDSVYSQESNIKIAQLTNQRDLEMKDKDIKIERLKSTIFIASIAFLLIIVLVGIMKFRKTLKNNEQLASEKEKHLEHIQVQGETLKDIAYIQSHYVRGPVTTILGLSQLFNYDNPEDPQNKELMAGIASVAVKLDHTVTDVINKENSIKHPVRGKQ